MCRGLKNGNTVVVCTMAAVASMVTGKALDTCRTSICHASDLCPALPAEKVLPARVNRHVHVMQYTSDWQPHSFLYAVPPLFLSSILVFKTMAAGVLAGLVALGEALPTSHAMKVARLGSWAAILLGVSSLAGVCTYYV
jgi:hypothetical protein